MRYLKDNILNRLIRFLLKHCYLYSPTVYAFVRKIPYEELKWYVDEWKKYNKEVMIND